MGKAEADVMSQKYNAEATGITEKAEAMKIFNEAGKEHEEFKLQLNKDKDVELAEIETRFRVAEQQAAIMAEALKQAHSILSAWMDEHPDSFPPIVINLTDGEPTTGDPMPDGVALMDLRTTDGEVLLFNGHLSSSNAAPVEFPDSEEMLPDQYAKALFAWSSELPDHIFQAAQQGSLG